MRVQLKDGKLQRSTEDAAAYDIFNNENDFVLGAGEQKTVSTGVITEMYGCFGLMRDRSGLASKFRVTTRGGVIDAKYPKEWGVILVNESDQNILIKRGDRIAQVIFLPQPPSHMVEAVGPNAIVIEKDIVRTGGLGSTSA